MYTVSVIPLMYILLPGFVRMVYNVHFVYYTVQLLIAGRPEESTEDLADPAQLS